MLLKCWIDAWNSTVGNFDRRYLFPGTIPSGPTYSAGSAAGVTAPRELEVISDYTVAYSVLESGTQVAAADANAGGGVRGTFAAIASSIVPVQKI